MESGIKEVRVRFAPSPTGALHIGGVRTALYNYLLARKFKGQMILRIEDTDQTRFVPGAEEYIKKSLEWVGISIDEGPDQGGPYGPYRQSERKSIYAGYAKQLIDSGSAYYAFDSEQELIEMRERLIKQGDPNQQYGISSRMSMNNSLTLSESETLSKLNEGHRHVIRFKVPENEDIILHDLIRGEVKVSSSQIDDKVLLKSDGMPTYHLANVVDDYLMKISHVIRGEEWLPSAPLHVLLYRYLGLQESMPQFAHLPLLLKPDGNGKLSKRDADKMGFPIFPLDWVEPKTQERSTGFKEHGYLPDALINFLAFLGWNPGTTQEIFTMEELVTAFDLEKINKAGARFDIQKAQWYNQQYLKNRSDEELASYLVELLQTRDLFLEKSKVISICHILKERIIFPQDLWEQGKFFIISPETYDEKTVSKKWTEETVSVLTEYKNRLRKFTTITAEQSKSLLEEITKSMGIGLGKVMQPLRVVITGGLSGPDLMASIEILGPIEVSERIDRAIEILPISPK